MFLLNTFLISITVITLVHSNTQICKRLTQCPPLLNMIKTKPNHEGTIQLLRSRHCGFDGRMPKVWCDNSNFMDFTCKTPNHLGGTCTPIKHCKYMVDLLKSLDLNNANAKAFILGHKCDNVENGNVSVCCPKNNMEIRELLPNSDQCGIADPIPLCPRGFLCVLNGFYTAVGEYPWMALLYFRKLNNDVYPGCAGSLITKKFVLTAAHCLDKHIWSTHNIEKVDHLVLGEFDIDANPDCFNGDCADPVQKFLVENLHIHHQWNRHTTQNDIALIKLKETVSYTRFIRPICLPKSGSNIEEIEEDVTVAGWGKTESGRSSSYLLQARLPIVKRSKCSFSRWKLSSKQLCIGVSKGSASCQGDSGGPVMYRDYDSGEAVNLIGIVSYGRTCGYYPGVYTHVTAYLDWIHEIIENDVILNG